MCTDQIRCLIHGHDREGLSSLKAALVLDPRKAPLHCTGAWRSSSEQGLQCVRGFKGLVWLQGNFLAPVLCASEASWPLYSSRDLKALSGSHTLWRPAERPNFGGGGEEQYTLVIVTIYTNLDTWTVTRTFVLLSAAFSLAFPCWAQMRLRIFYLLRQQV